MPTAHDYKKKSLVELLKNKGLASGNQWQINALSADGSSRRFFRILRPAENPLIGILPPVDLSKKSLAEARSTFLIGRHLFEKKVPVPDILAFDESTGALVCEDLGDTMLQQAVQQNPQQTRELYTETLKVLVHMQFKAREGFDPDWCWDSPSYDKKLMLEKESSYFLEAFCQGYLELTTFDTGLDKEFHALADRAAAEPAGFFLHRDFQSRNLMVHDGKIRVIDFQGGRLGPIGYDLASLLVDPYVSLAEDLKDELLAYYIRLAASYGLDKDTFMPGYYALFLQRNLQILGAFSFLSKVQGKPFFTQYIKPALVSLHEHLAKPPGDDYPCLRTLAKKCLDNIANT